MHLVMIGGSDAGISAALRARELDPSADVTVVVGAERFARRRLQALARAQASAPDRMPAVLFLCVHNAGRSQMALRPRSQPHRETHERLELAGIPSAAVTWQAVPAGQMAQLRLM